MTLLLSYPRSGSGWVRYIIEVCTGRPTINVGPIKTGILDEYAALLDDPSVARWIDRDAEPIAVKAHFLLETRKAKIPPEKLILLRRNPLEVIPSYMAGKEHMDPQEFLDQVTVGDVMPQTWLYGDGLAAFALWPRPKHVVEYEDLIKDPEGTVVDLIEFLGEGDAGLILNNMDHHRDVSMAAKLRGGPPCYTKGAAGFAFANTLPDDVREFIEDALVK